MKGFASTLDVMSRWYATSAASRVHWATAVPLPLWPMSKVYRDTPERVHSALWTSVGHVGVPRLPLIVDELQFLLRGRPYDS